MLLSTPLYNQYKDKRLLGEIKFPNIEKVYTNIYLSITESSIYIEVTVNVPEKESWSLITGDFNKIGRVSFLNCRTRGGYKSGVGGSLQRIYIDFISCGRHYDDLAELKFKGLVLTSASFTRWIQHRDTISHEENENGDIFTIPYPELISDFKFKEYEVKIISEYVPEYTVNYLKAEKRVRIKVTSKTPKSIDELFLIAHRFKKFILLATNKNPAFQETLLIEKDEYKSELITLPKDLQDELFPPTINLRHTLIIRQLEDVLKPCLFDERIDLALDLILERHFNSQMTSKSFFLNACIALEGFYDTFNSVESLDYEGKIKKKLNEISDYIKNKDLSEWFNSKAKWWVNPSLRRKFDFYKPTIKHIQGNSFTESVDELIGKIIDTRNDMAHRGVSDQNFNNIEIMLAGKLLELTFKIELYKLLKVDIYEKRYHPIDNATGILRMLATINDYNIPKK